MSARLLWPAAWVAAPGVLRAQAALEYALRSGQAATATSDTSSIAGCKVDSGLFSCLTHNYPRATIAVAVVLSILVLRWIAGSAGYGRR